MKKIKVSLYIRENNGNRSLIAKTNNGTEYNINTIGWGIPVSIEIKTDDELVGEQEKYRENLHKEVEEIKKKNDEKKLNWLQKIFNL